MGQIRVQNVDIRYPGSEKVSDKNGAKEVNDDFKKLLQDRPEEKQEVSEDTKEPVVKEDSKDTGKVEDTKAEEMLTALQMGQALLGIQNLQVNPEEVSELQAADTEEVAAVMPEIEVLPENAQMPKEAGIVNEAGQTENVPDTAQAEMIQIPKQETGNEAVSSDGKESPVTSEEKEPKADVKVDTDKTSKNQTEAVEPQNTVDVQPAVNQTVQRTEPVREERPVYTERMQVSKPEEIPQKLTEELVVKTANGIKEFEIQIAPEHLGKIAIKVLYEHGQTTVSIACTEKHTLDLLSQHAREIGNVMERNLGEETTIYVEKNEPDYLNPRDNENDHSGREAEQERHKEERSKQKPDESGQFLQKLRLGLVE